MTKQGKMPKDTNQRAASIVAQATADREETAPLKKMFLHGFPPIPVDQIGTVVLQTQTEEVRTAP